MRPWAVAAGDFTTLGGMDRANHALARHLALAGRDVHLVAHRVADDLSSLRGVHIHKVARPLRSHLAGTPLLTYAAARESRRLGDGAACVANGGNADWPVTWVHYLHAAHAPQALASLRARASAILSRRYYLARERRVLGSAAVVICNSRRTADDVMRAYPIASERVHVVYYGSDATTFGPAHESERATIRSELSLAPERRLALFAGALGDRRKGFDVLFAAWAVLVDDSSWDVDLAVAGTGAERDAWIARAERQGIASRIRFLGFRRDIAAVLAAADVFVHPARYEAYGLSVHEAVCRGVPSIVTASAGVAEHFTRDLRPLLLPDPPTVPALVAALRAWRGDAGAWRAAVAPMAERLRARSWDDMAADIVGLVEAA